MAKRDRLNFINNLTEPDNEEKIDTIVDRHYNKMNIFYDLINFLDDYSEKDNIDSWKLDDCDETLSIHFKLVNNKTKSLQKIVESFFSDKEDTFIVSINSTKNKINISISTVIDEEEQYEYRLDSDE